jgi:hypothetical protein
MKAYVLAVLVVVGIIVGGFAVLYAAGSPTGPQAQLQGTITPSSAQTLIVNVNMGAYSLVAINTVWGLGVHFTYTAVELTSTGQRYVLASNATIAPSVGSSSGSFYQLNGVITLTTTAACSAANCAGVIENITLTMSGTVVTPFKAWVSPTTTTVFTSLDSNAPIPALPPAKATPAALNSFLLELLAPLTILVAFEAFGFYGVGTRHPAILLTGIGAAVLIVVEFLVL